MYGKCECVPRRTKVYVHEPLLVNRYKCGVYPEVKLCVIGVLCCCRGGGARKMNAQLTRGSRNIFPPRGQGFKLRSIFHS